MSHTTLHIERDLDNKQVSVSIDTSASGPEALDAKYGQLAMGYADKISAEKTLEMLEHVPDEGTSLKLTSYAGQGVDEDGVDEGAMAISVSIENNACRNYIGGAKVPSMVMGCTLYTMLREAIGNVSSHEFIPAGEDDEDGFDEFMDDIMGDDEDFM